MTPGLIAGAALLVILIGWTIWLYRQGRQSAKGDAAKEALTDAEKARRIDEEVARKSDDAILADLLRDIERKRLRDIPKD